MAAPDVASPRRVSDEHAKATQHQEWRVGRRDFAPAVALPQEAQAREGAGGAEDHAGLAADGGRQRARPYAQIRPTGCRGAVCRGRGRPGRGSGAAGHSRSHRAPGDSHPAAPEPQWHRHGADPLRPSTGLTRPNRKRKERIMPRSSIGDAIAGWEKAVANARANAMDVPGMEAYLAPMEKILADAKDVSARLDTRLAVKQ